LESKVPVSKLETRNSKFEGSAKSRLWGKFRISSFEFPKRSLCWMATIAVIFVAWLAFPEGLAAQGCALCYNTAAAAGVRGTAALRNGILILMIPPVIIFGVVCFFAVRGRNRFNDEG
jgi:hypothetical protein